MAATERLVFADSGPDPVEAIYGLEREVAEARRALLPMTAELPELGEDDLSSRGGPGHRVLSRVVGTVLAGVYGMNVAAMPELHWAYGYPLTLGTMAAGCFVLYRVFKRAGWL